ncbi:hypothetical protein AGMMS49944_09680 [Spirochaetia bacterium]|nr:hypothetical protein AGMMS49944_09680 [Spirochaetia bacterium]
MVPWGIDPGNIWESYSLSLAEAAGAILDAYTGIFLALLKPFDCFVKALYRMNKALTEAINGYCGKTDN